MSTRSLSTPSAIHIVVRIASAVLGSYIAVWGFMALTLAGFYGLGMPFHDAEHASSILGFLLYLTLFLWVFAVRKLGRTSALLLGSGLLMSALASLIQSWLV